MVMVHFCEHRKVHVDAQKIHGCTCTCISIACWVYCCSIPSCCRALCIKVIFLVFLPGRLQTVLNLFEYVNGECLDAQSATNTIFNSCLTSEDEVVSVPWTIKHNSNNMSVFQNIIMTYSYADCDIICSYYYIMYLFTCTLFNHINFADYNGNV